MLRLTATHVEGEEEEQEYQEEEEEEEVLDSPKVDGPGCLSELKDTLALVPKLRRYRSLYAVFPGETRAQLGRLRKGHRTVMNCFSNQL